MNDIQLFNHQLGFVESDAKFPALVTGFGGGKTFAFCLKALYECGMNPGKTILLAEPTYSMIEDVLMPGLTQAMSLVGFDFEYRASRRKYRVFWNGGWADILLRSAGSYERWAGLNLAAFGLDEAALLKSDGAWKMGISRLRDGNTLRGFISTTPEGFNWVYENWEDSVRAGYELFRGKTTDNWELPDEFIQSLYDYYDARLVKAYINGEFVNLTQGQVYYSFDRSLHIPKLSPVRYMPDVPLEFSFDFNVNPMTAVVSQKATKQVLNVLDAIAIPTSNTDEMVKHLIDVYRDHRAGVALYGDATASRLQTSARGFSDHRIINEAMQQFYGFRNVHKMWKSGNPYERDRIKSVNSRLKNSRGEISCFFSPKARYLTRELEQMAYKENSGVIDTKSEKVGHVTSAFGYRIEAEWPALKSFTARR